MPSPCQCHSFVLNTGIHNQFFLSSTDREGIGLLTQLEFVRDRNLIYVECLTFPGGLSSLGGPRRSGLCVWSCPGVLSHPSVVFFFPLVWAFINALHWLGSLLLRMASPKVIHLAAAVWYFLSLMEELTDLTGRFSLPCIKQLSPPTRCLIWFLFQTSEGREFSSAIERNDLRD